MTTRYEYNCNQCGADYIEQRKDTDAQFFTSCQACSSGTYVEITSTFIEADEITPEVIDETAPE